MEGKDNNASNRNSELPSSSNIEAMKEDPPSHSDAGCTADESDGMNKSKPNPQGNFCIKYAQSDAIRLIISSESRPRERVRRQRPAKISPPTESDMESDSGDDLPGRISLDRDTSRNISKKWERIAKRLCQKSDKKPSDEDANK